MADEDLSLDDVKDETKDASEEGESSGGSKKKLIIIIAASVVSLIVVAVAVYFLVFAGSEEETVPVTESEVTASDDGATETETEEVVDDIKALPKKGKAIYISVPDPFLVNIKSGKRTRMLQIKIQFLVRSIRAEDLVKQHLPLIRNDLLDFFSLADADEVRTREGRNALKEGALSISKKVMEDQTGLEAIEMVLFTGFVVQ